MAKDKKKNRQILKHIIDAAMTILLLLLMGFQFWGDFFHEWAGAGMFVLFILHHILNLGWYKNLFHGKYTPVRLFWVFLNLLVLAAMLGLMVSGIMLSRHVFVFLSIGGGSAFARILHMLSAYWGFVLMALHLGLHWNMVMRGPGRLLEGYLPAKAGKPVSLGVGTVIALYGMSVFIRRDLLDYMLLRTQFVFLDFGESRILFFVDYLAMMGLFIYIAHYLRILFLKMGRRKKTGEDRNDKKRRMQNG